MSEDDGLLELTEAQAFGGWVIAALARSPETALAAISEAFPESRIRAAQRAIARKPDDFAPEPYVEPDSDEPGIEYCDWCGRSSPEGGLTRFYETPYRAWPSEPDPETLGRHIPVYRKVTPEPPEVEDNYPHCVDERACYGEREQRIDGWRRHQFPDWRLTLRDLARLAQQKEEARAVLASAQAAGYAIAAWAELQDQLTEPEDDLVVLSAYSGTEPFSWAISAQGVDPLWGHTMRGNPLNRVHTHGYQVAQYGYPHLPAAGAAQEATASASAGRPLRKPVARLPVRRIRRRIRPR